MSTRTLPYEPARAALDIAVLCLALALPSAIAWGLDSRTLHGVNIWIKPLKFHLSFGLHWLTIACLLQALGQRAASAKSLQWWLRIGGLATVAEVLYITLQAARGRASHFNFSTPLESVLYFALMGGAAVLIMLATIWVGWLLWRHAEPAQRRSGLWLGAVLGLIVGSIVTLLVTAPLASGAIDGPGHWVGGVRTDVAGLPIVGWSTTGGDLRGPHFFGTHLLQFLPLVGWVADRSGSSAPRR
ncbi:hypothetical protein DBR42_05010, partial [Pelomonas sp. HMWF004]